MPFSGNPLYTLTLPHFPLTSLFNVSHSHSNATETRAPDYITALCQTQLHQLHTSDHQHARWQQAYVCCSRRSIVPMGFAHSGFTLHFILLTFLLLVLIFFNNTLIFKHCPWWWDVGTSLAKRDCKNPLQLCTFGWCDHLWSHPLEFSVFSKTGFRVRLGPWCQAGSFGWPLSSRLNLSSSRWISSSCASIFSNRHPLNEVSPFL